jgi:hypothetical protein
MKLQERLPDGVVVNGRFYRMNFDFRNVLRMMEIMGRNDLMPNARDYLALKCLTKHPRNVPEVLTAVRLMLFEKRPSQNQQKVTSFEQDAGLIRAAFRQEYGIDLFRDKLHWLEFVELLQGLPEGSRYSEVVGIRARPMPAATKWNGDERRWLAEAKAKVALKIDDEEREQNYQRDVANIFSGLMSMVKKEVKQDA